MSYSSPQIYRGGFCIQLNNMEKNTGELWCNTWKTWYKRGKYPNPLAWDLRVGACRELPKLELAERVGPKPSTLHLQAAQKSKSIMWTWLMVWDACSAQLRRCSCITRIHPSSLKCLWNLARKGETNKNTVKSLRCSTLFNISGHCPETAVAHCCICSWGHISWDRNGAAAPSSQAGWGQVTSGKQQ